MYALVVRHLCLSGYKVLNNDTFNNRCLKPLVLLNETVVKPEAEG